MQSHELRSPGSIEQQYEQIQQALQQRRALSAQTEMVATLQLRSGRLARYGARFVGRWMVQLGASLLHYGQVEDTASTDGSTLPKSGMQMHRVRSTITDQ